MFTACCLSLRLPRPQSALSCSPGAASALKGRAPSSAARARLRQDRIDLHRDTDSIPTLRDCPHRSALSMSAACVSVSASTSSAIMRRTSCFRCPYVAWRCRRCTCAPRGTRASAVNGCAGWQARAALPRRRGVAPVLFALSPRVPNRHVTRTALDSALSHQLALTFNSGPVQAHAGSPGACIRAAHRLPGMRHAQRGAHHGALQRPVGRGAARAHPGVLQRLRGRQAPVHVPVQQALRAPQPSSPSPPHRRPQARGRDRRAGPLPSPAHSSRAACCVGCPCAAARRPRRAACWAVARPALPIAQGARRRPVSTRPHAEGAPGAPRGARAPSAGCARRRTSPGACATSPGRSAW